MKVLISKSVFSTTGSAQCSQDIIKSFVKKNIPLTVLSLESRNNLNFTKNQFESYKNLKWVTYYKTISKNSLDGIHFFKKIYSKLKFPFLRFIFNYKIEKLRIDHLFVNSTGSLDMFQKIFFTKNIDFRLTLIVHESPDITNYKKDKKDKQYYLDKFSFFSDFIFVSENVRDDWIHFLNLDRKKTFCIPNTIHENLTIEILKQNMVQLKKESGFSLSSKTVLCVASVQYLKGQDILIEASKKVWDIDKINFNLVFIGNANVSFGKEISNSIDLLKKDYNINHLNSVSPDLILKYIASADIIVLPSRTEALPRVILESMALKKPIIASNVGGMNELLENEKEGLLFKSEDINSLSFYLKKLLTDDKLSNQLSKKAYEKYWKFYSRDIYDKNWDKYLTKFEA